jgi:hypothetical protein
MGVAWDRVSVAAISVAVLTVAGCASDRTPGENAASPSSVTTNTSPEAVLASTCPTNNLTNLAPPDQVVPALANDDRLIGVDLLPFPEGPSIEVNEQTADSAMQAALRKGAATLAQGLPAALPQECCSKTEVRLHFDSGQIAVYGPCTLPDAVDTIATEVGDAWAAANP